MPSAFIFFLEAEEKKKESAAPRAGVGFIPEPESTLEIFQLGLNLLTVWANPGLHGLESLFSSASISFGPNLFFLPG